MNVFFVLFLSFVFYPGPGYLKPAKTKMCRCKFENGVKFKYECLFCLFLVFCLLSRTGGYLKPAKTKILFDNGQTLFIKTFLRLHVIRFDIKLYDVVRWSYWRGIWQFGHRL